MAFVREAMLKLITGGVVRDLEQLKERVEENTAAIERWTEQPKDFWPMKNQDAFPVSNLDTSYDHLLIVVAGKLYIRQGTNYVLVGSQT